MFVCVHSRHLYSVYSRVIHSALFAAQRLPGSGLSPRNFLPGSGLSRRNFLPGSGLSRCNFCLGQDSRLATFWLGQDIFLRLLRLLTLENDEFARETGHVWPL